MGYVNKVMLMGNTTRAPEMRKSASGEAVCAVGMATKRVFKTTSGESREEVLFVECKAFGRTAQVIAEFCPKGISVFVEGRLHFESWEEKCDGAAPVKRSRLVVIIERIQLLGMPANTSQGAQAAPRQVQAAAAPGFRPAPVRGHSPRDLDRMAEEAQQMELAGASR